MTMLYKNDIRFNSWKEFIGYLSNMPQSWDTYFWRGQGNAKWEIESSLMRWIKKQKHRGTVQTNTYASKYYTEMLKQIPVSERNIPLTNVYGINPIRPLEEQQIYKINRWKKIIEAHYQPRDYFDFFCGDHGSNFDFTFGFPQDITNWIWAQHYGIKSLLVDWTKFPLYALFFALEGLKMSEDFDNIYCIAIYKLCERSLNHFNTQDFLIDEACCSADCYERINSYYKMISIFYSNNKPQFLFNPVESLLKDEKTFYDNKEQIMQYVGLLCDGIRLKLIDSESSHNERIIAQGGLFTFSPLGLSIEEWIPRREMMFKESMMYKSWKKLTGFKDFRHTPLLEKMFIYFREKDIDDCYRFLESNNITHTSIYPDFEGASKRMRYFEHQLSKITCFNEVII